jgi:hypothetical protein
MGKFQFILFLKSSFDGGLFFHFYFGNIITYFLSPHFSLFLHDKCNVIISRVHYESIVFLKFIHKI